MIFKLKHLAERVFRFVYRTTGRLKTVVLSAKPRSVRFEISVIYTIILGVILIVFSGVFYLILSRTLYAELDNELRLKAQEISQNITTYVNVKGETPNAFQFAVEKTIASEGTTLRRWWYVGFERGWFRKLDEQDLSGDYINFIDPTGASMVRSKNMTDDLLSAFLGSGREVGGKETYHYISKGDTRLRVVNFPFTHKNGETYILQVGISPKPIIFLLQGWMKSIFLSIPIILILTSFIGHILTSRILKPIEKITKTARNITYHDLSMRVESQNYYSEMNSLISAFNDMISRLQKSFNHIEEFSAHVAHELKTPLTIIRGETELALYKERSVEEYKEALNVNLKETDKILRTIEDLLLLAKMDYQPEVFNFEVIDFNEFFSEIYQQAQVLCAQKNICINYQCPRERIFNVKADKVHLRRLFFNLVDNAIKFTPPQGEINILIDSDRLKLKIEISDNGIGIKEEDIPKVFDRFYRVDGQRIGAGLGLNIAQTITKIHNGSISVTSLTGNGSTFTVILPLVSKQVSLTQTAVS